MDHKVTKHARPPSLPRRTRVVTTRVSFFALTMLVALVAFVATSSRARADGPARGPFALDGNDWEGCSELVALAKDELGPRRVVPTGTLDYAALRPQDGVILLHPEKTLDTGSLSRFMRTGGRVAMLDDFGSGDALLEHFGLKRVPLPRHPAETLRQNPALAIAEPASLHPVVTDVTRVVTNHASGLAHPDLSPVLKIRGGDGEPDVLVAVAGAVGQGRLLVIGDPSVVMNSMLRYPGNRNLARGILRYVADDDVWGKRDGRIYLVANGFEQHGVYGEEPGVATDLGERMRSLEDLFSSIRKDGAPPWLAYAVAVAVGLGLVMWVGTNAGRPHKAVAPRFTRAIPLAAQGGVAGHAAVVAAKGTARALALLELKGALEDELAGLMGMAEVPAPGTLLGEVAKGRLLDGEGLAALKALMLRMANVETLVLSRQAALMHKITDDEVLGTARRVRRIVDEAKKRKASGSAGA